METSRRTFRNLNIFLMIAAMGCLVYYDYQGGIFLKGFTSFWFALLGFVNLVYGWKSGCRSFLLLLEIGLILSAAADVILWHHFVLGTGIFAVGHLFYFAAFCTAEKIRAGDLIPIGAAAMVSLFAALGTPFIRTEGVMTCVLAGYAVVISCMLGKAIANILRAKTRSRWLMLVGGILFWFSDLMLAISIFGSGGKVTNFLCMYSYWPGQTILAHAMFHAASEE